MWNSRIVPAVIYLVIQCNLIYFSYLLQLWGLNRPTCSNRSLCFKWKKTACFPPMLSNPVANPAAPGCLFCNTLYCVGYKNKRGIGYIYWLEYCFSGSHVLVEKANSTCCSNAFSCVGWEIIIAGFSTRGAKERPVDSIGSSCGGIIVCRVKWHKWLSFNGHTLQGPEFILTTMAHNSQGSSQVDRLTHTAPAAHLRTSLEAWTCSGHMEEVTVTNQVTLAISIFTQLLNACKLFVKLLQQLENPISVHVYTC